MKRANTLQFTASLVAALSLVAASAQALTLSQDAAVQKAVVSTPAIELAAKAAELVSQAAAGDKVDTAVAVVRATASKNVGSVSSVVSAVLTVAPEAASKVIAAVAQVAADQVEAAAQVAVRVAPDQAQAIIAGVAAVAPQSSEKVTAAIKTEQAAPQSANSVRAFPPGSGGIVRKTVIPINPRLVFPIIPPKSVSNYAAPGADPNRPF